jgi:5-methylcytosine-specific restriction endonuclease McrA
MRVAWVTPKELLARQERARRVKKKAHLRSVQATPASQRCWVCQGPITWPTSETACSERCRRLLWDESYRIDRIREESRRKGHRADITLEEWARAIRYFKGVCAFCGTPFDTCDHIIPRHLGGASTAANMVPACFQCNTTKGGRVLDAVDDLPATGVARVRAYVAWVEGLA